MSTGTLFVIATPIGNMADWSQRAIDTIAEIDLLAAEDTRRTKILLSYHSLNVRVTSIHEHNEKDKSGYIVELLMSGKNVGLVSDAGTPLISDPGFNLVKLAQKNNIKISPLPGACAAIAALSVAALPTDRFCFEGFLPSKEGERKNKLLALASEPRTLIFYESPSRILKSINNMVEIFGAQRDVVFARELTKTFETVKSGTLESIKTFIASDKNQELGEIVIIVSGDRIEKKLISLSLQEQKLIKILVKKYTVKDAVDIVREISKAKKQDIYNYALTVN